MSISKSFSAQLSGLKAEIITIEVDISNGLHNFSVVGLGDRSIEESKDRIAAAIKNTGYVSPKQKNQKVVISLAPADLKKEGPSFDLCMAVTYLAAAQEFEFDSENYLILGELSLEGYVRRVNGLLPILCQAQNLGFSKIIIPRENIEEASLARDIKIFPVSSLRETIDFILGEKEIEPIKYKNPEPDPVDFSEYDMSFIRGNECAKRGLEIAAAGSHNIAMCGPPGTGKTMLAKSFRSILPPLSYEQSVEVTGIHSAAKALDGKLITRPPFRSPHHTASYPSIVGGGAFPKPGEITLAHRGVLFLDEVPEFDRTVIEALRQPLEDREITVSRAKGCLTFPAHCIFIVSMNPCPCGKGKEHGCKCSKGDLSRYHRKLSGPIMDRIDIFLDVSKVDYNKLAMNTERGEKSSEILKRIIVAREIQQKRLSKTLGKKIFNSEMSVQEVEKYSLLSIEAKNILTSSARQLSISGRVFHRLIKIARTIADLAGEEAITKEHMLEAIQYRDKSIIWN